MLLRTAHPIFHSFWVKLSKTECFHRHFSTPFATFPHKNCGNVYIWPLTALAPTRKGDCLFFVEIPGHSFFTAYEKKFRLWKCFFLTLWICGKLSRTQRKWGKVRLFSQRSAEKGVENPVEKSIFNPQSALCRGCQNKICML